MRAVADIGFQLGEEIGHGSSSIIYAGFSTNETRPLAVKVIKQKIVDIEDFDNQIGIMLHLGRHPHIVEVLCPGKTEDGCRCIVMEYMAGGNLRQRAESEKKSRLKAGFALKITAQLLLALEFAHAGNVIHGDIKPENILLDKVGNIKLGDFGSAQVLGSQSYGDFRGTRQYTAPEGLEEESRIDHRSDLWCVGVVLYEMLTGEMPFKSDDCNNQIAYLHRLQQVLPKRLSEFGLKVEEGLQGIIDRALAKRKEDRFQSASEFLDALQNANLYKLPVSLRDYRRRDRFEAIFNNIDYNFALEFPRVFPSNFAERIKAYNLAHPEWTRKDELDAIRIARNKFTHQKRKEGQIEFIPTPKEAALLEEIALELLPSLPASDIPAEDNVERKQTLALYRQNRKEKQNRRTYTVIPVTQKERSANVTADEAMLVPANPKQAITVLPGLIVEEQMPTPASNALSLYHAPNTGIVTKPNVSNQLILLPAGAMSGVVPSLVIVRKSQSLTTPLASQPSSFTRRSALILIGFVLTLTIGFFVGKVVLTTRHSANSSAKNAMSAPLGSPIEQAMGHFRNSTSYLRHMQYTLAEQEIQEAIRIYPNKGIFHSTLATIYSSEKRFKQAEDEAKIAIHLNPQDADFHGFLGQVYRDQKQYKDADEEFHIALKLDPNSSSTYLDLGMNFSEQEHYDQAEHMFQKAIKLAPEDVNGYNDLGNLYLQQKRYPEAEKVYYQAVTFAPSDAYVHCNLGLVYAALKRNLEAEKQYQEAIHLDPELVVSYTQLALLYSALNRYTEADEIIKKAIVITPNEPDVYTIQGDIYTDQNRYAEAVSAYQNAVKLDPHDKDYRNKLQEAQKALSSHTHK